MSSREAKPAALRYHVDNSNQLGTGARDGIRGACPFLGRSAGLNRNLVALKSLILVSFTLLASAARAQVPEEYQIKAVFLLRLAQFTEWPAEAFDHPQGPILICVAGDNPFDDTLEAAVRGESAHGRALAVQHTRGLDQIRRCHIVYLSPSVARRVKEISAALAGRSILTVMDAEMAPGAYHAMIRFVTEDNRVKLVIDLKAATAAGLVLDPRLLRSAEIAGS